MLAPAELATIEVVMGETKNSAVAPSPLPVNHPHESPLVSFGTMFRIHNVMIEVATKGKLIYPWRDANFST